ncbi:DNA-binding transcriptional regulator LsrR (DeoR family) [Rhodobium orientis]|uniref:DNA-binding transcriptional regulator n=1 Tax=Rhodobium orientis TaxID=34017 RepID=A0A327JQ36_9HYPH|nr:sugar-binding transcriptional regulator [Rhodobium orientis]MBB4301723.1 DNA-binding transcriptional regulator LsrR (DeoR family) [Rhodobium orientis]MBK5950526.1 DNA-binding transcriptional regulator [Rhodobium orientis]RAI28171.1 DNA-binding transcriptional regulator [Rhodobium orientis]
MADGSDGLTGGMDAEHLVARVAWYYYVANMTQQEIADRLGLTRLRVNKIIGQVRADGSVQVEIRLPLASCVALEEELKSRFKLQDAVVVPSIRDEVAQKRVIGEAAGVLLNGMLKDGQTIGLGWGDTLGAAVRKLTPRQFSRTRVVSLMGGLTRGSGANTFEVASQLARALGAECHYIPSLLYYPDDESFAGLMAYPPLAEVMAEARQADLVLVSCGDLSGRSQLFSAVSLSPRDIDELKEKGAVGELLGTFLDADGKDVDHPLNKRVMALHPSGLGNIAKTILASGDAYKLPIIRAILKLGNVTHLVTDEAVAEGLMRG